MKEWQANTFVVLIVVLIVGAIIYGVGFGRSNDGHMSNDRIIVESKKCRDAGMKARYLRDGYSHRTVGIECEEPDK